MSSLSWLVEPSEWWRIYRELITSTLKLSFHRDQEAADTLSRLLASNPHAISAEELFEMIKGRSVALVVGCSEDATRELDYALELTSLSRATATISAANGALRLLLERGVRPDLVVTDLDGSVDNLLEVSARGVPLVVHAHGDNIENLVEVVPRLRGPVVGSTQVEPRPLVYNFGGFTDGDRATYILHHAGYRRVLLVGFDFEKPSSCPGKDLRDPATKLAKLKAARTLLLLLVERGVEISVVRCSGGSCGQVLLDQSH